jgi:hypothetical protein
MQLIEWEEPGGAGLVQLRDFSLGGPWAPLTGSRTSRCGQRKSGMLRGMAAQTKSGGQFDLQPILTGELLQLRPLQPADFDALFSAASDPLIWEQHPESDRYIREVFQRYFDTAIDSGGAFAIIDRSSGRIIVCSRLFIYFRETNELDIGWTFL